MGEASRRNAAAFPETAAIFSEVVAAVYEFEAEVSSVDRHRCSIRIRTIFDALPRQEVRKRYDLSPEAYWRALNCAVPERDAATPRLAEVDAACAAREFPDDFDVSGASDLSWFDDCRPEVGFNLATYGHLPADIAAGDDFNWFRFLVWKYGANGGARMFYENGAFAEDLREAEALHGPGGQFFTLGGTRFLPRGDRFGNIWPGHNGLR